MKQLIALLFSALLISGSALAGDKQKEFKKLSLDAHGKVFFEEIYNVNRRSNMEILRYAVEFANDHGRRTSDKHIDKEMNQVSFVYTFPLKNALISAWA